MKKLFTILIVLAMSGLSANADIPFSLSNEVHQKAGAITIKLERSRRSDDVYRAPSLNIQAYECYYWEGKIYIAFDDISEAVHCEVKINAGEHSSTYNVTVGDLVKGLKIGILVHFDISITIESVGEFVGSC